MMLAIANKGFYVKQSEAFGSSVLNYVECTNSFSCSLYSILEMNSISQARVDVPNHPDHFSPYRANTVGLRVLIPDNTNTGPYGTIWTPAPVEEPFLGSVTPVYDAVAYDADGVEIPLLRLEDLLRSIQREVANHQARLTRGAMTNEN
ncbi:unnamed protein product [Rhizoctonia solani]|uniref:Uncharacterized protein n=1 Tax=Rhizoctonia solani TaxID=456999 RepID=A0A8H3CR07_9AGAM|nr:unnamed protein product [Rhizoctonia solani]CAE6489598.1 unnamed protein product [Rhizoctonia solani]